MMTEQQADLARWAAEAVRALHTGLARATEVHRLLGAGMDPATVAEAVAQAIDCATSGLDHLRAIQRHAGGAGPCHCRVCGDRGTFDDHVDLCPECRKKTEWVAVLHGQTGTVKIAYRNARALAVGLEGQTKEGWMVASVYQRVAETYSEV